MDGVASSVLSTADALPTCDGATADGAASTHLRVAIEGSGFARLRGQFERFRVTRPAPP